jgi:[acyl-carrier-protein] S-malonyltransferase
VKLVLLFPGQGSQEIGMGADLGAAGLLAEASEALGEDLAAVVAGGPADQLTRTLYAQPAVVAVSLAALHALRAAAAERGIELDPLAVAGHSVGELAAMAAAGAFDEATILRLVVERARAMERACVEVQGGMAAVLGLEAEAVEQACRTAAEATGEVAEPANYNASHQIVIAGTLAALEAAGAEAQRLGARGVVPLKVAGPFHTSLMRGAAETFAPFVHSVHVAPPPTPVVLNFSAQETRDPAQLREELCLQVAQPVRWAQTMTRCVELGAEAFVELGPGQVLSGLARRAARGVPTFNVQDRASLESTLESLATLQSAVPVR